MPISLDEWQKRLELHFDDVTLAKLDQPHEPVTFAIEHGLNSEERAALAAEVRKSVQALSLQRDHYLCWAVYAAEVGYHYAGDEYWHSFTSQTPGWDQSYRWFIKSCLRNFSEQYNGAIPRGAWARNFSIICWPITHAILPTDLQRQLAEILYRIRHTVVVDDVSSPGQLGQIIAANSFGTTSRFAQLASEPELIGQIASALLRDDQSGEWIEASALDRITQDLNVEEQARSWLHHAKDHVSRRAQVKGLKGGRRAPRGDDTSGAQAPRPKIRPTLALRPVRDNQWRLVVEAPNFTPLVRHYSEVQPILQRATVRLGSHERSYSGRALLHSSLPVPQLKWPTPLEPLIKVEPSHPDLDALLMHETCMSPGPWLFRLNQDGIAAEVRTGRVSLEADYVLVTNRDTDSPIGEQVDVGCDDVTAWRFSVSSLDEIENTLREWQLLPARQIIARPTGLPAVRWDREGAAEWLSTHHPIISLKSNFAISRFEAQIDISNQVLLASAEPREQNVAHLILPVLPAGTYYLQVSAHPVDTNLRVEQGEMEISIRDALPDDDRAVALIVAQEPTEATLNQLFEGEVSFVVHGPGNRNASASLRLLKRDRISPLVERSIAPLAFPVSKETFTQRFDRLLSKDDELSRAYLQADACEIQFGGTGLGSCVHRFERPFTPLRWGLLESKDDYSITLFEDVANPDEIETMRYEFSTPLKARRLTANDLTKASNGITQPGLYVAKSEQYLASSIVPVRSLEELRTIRPRFFRPERDLESVKHYLETIGLWYCVESRGNLFGRYPWRVAIHALVQQVVGLISGTPWYKAERAFERNRDLLALSKRIPYKHWGEGWPESLMNAIAEFAKSPVEQRVARFATLTGHPVELCDFALRMTSQPATLFRGDSSNIDRSIRTVMQRSELVRAARFVVLGTATMTDQSIDVSHQKNVGWKWS